MMKVLFVDNLITRNLSCSGALRTGSSNAYVLRTYAEVNGKNEIIYEGVANG